MLAWLNQLSGVITLTNHNINYEQFSATLERNGVIVDGAEVHGVIIGMLAGGMALENRDWIEALADFIHQGESLPEEVKQLAMALHNQSCQQLVEADFSLTLCLPDDAAPINDRGQALINWVQGFLLGFGLQQADMTQCSDDIKEALEDFAEISKMDDSMHEDEESEQALFEVEEYVRVSAMLCFNELGKAATAQSPSQSIH